MKAPILAWAIVPFIFACGNTPNTTSNQLAPVMSVQESSTPPTYLEGIYATSTAPGSSVESLFDGNPATIWRTRSGAGPDEGIMLYFQDDQVVSTVEIKATPGSFKSGSGAQMKIYGNGTALATGSPESTISLGDKPLKSLFIQFLSTGNETQTTNQDVTMVNYPNDASVGIADIVLHNEKGEALRITSPKGIKGTAVASSTLIPEAAYSTANLFDGRKEFCWVEGNASAGEGETIQLTWNNDPSVGITALQVWNGYQRSDEHFTANARVREIEISGGSAPANSYSLADTKAGQMIQLKEAITGGRCTLKIKSVYPGAKYKDLAISEIVLFQGKTPCVLQTELPAKFQAALLEKTSTSPIARLLDRQISNQTNIDESATSSQSLLLRSDGTFVVYTSIGTSDETVPSEEQATIADGNWELLRTDANSATVKIFGKWTDFSNLDEYYQGASEAVITRIFKEELRIEKNKVTGTKMLGAFLF